jgi:hypothetical protein
MGDVSLLWAEGAEDSKRTAAAKADPPNLLWAGGAEDSERTAATT